VVKISEKQSKERDAIIDYLLKNSLTILFYKGKNAVNSGTLNLQVLRKCKADAG
jgi:hypothetical protein